MAAKNLGQHIIINSKCYDSKFTTDGNNYSNFILKKSYLIVYLWKNKIISSQEFQELSKNVLCADLVCCCSHVSSCKNNCISTANVREFV